MRLREPAPRQSWRWVLYPMAAEGYITSSIQHPQSRPPAQRSQCDVSPSVARSGHESEVRATVRRYLASHDLVCMWTLTFADPCSDMKLIMKRMAQFRRLLRKTFGPYPYFWVAEADQSGRSVHVHLALTSGPGRSTVESAWPHGLVLAPLPAARRRTIEDGPVEAARALVDYLMKAPLPTAGGTRYHRARGFSIPVYVSVHNTLEQATAAARAANPRAPAWHSTVSYSNRRLLHQLRWQRRAGRGPRSRY